MKNNGFIGVPIGGVIPWIGEAYGLDLPSNFMRLDGDGMSSIPMESPFYNLIDSLPDMTDLTFHCVEGEASVGEVNGADKTDIGVVKTDLPSDYGYECKNGSYTGRSNYDLDDGVIQASFATKNMLSSSQYFGYSTIGLDNTNDNAGGSGDGYLEYSTSASAYNGKFPHRHYADASHNHSISSSSKTVTESQTIEWGDVGSNKAIELDTSVNSLSRVACYFVIRLW